MLERRVWFIEKPGSINRLKIKSEALSDLSETSVRVAIKAIGLNYADIFTVLGLYKAAPKKDVIPGLEFSGEVIATGRSVKEFKTGDRVMGVSKFGAYATVVDIDENYVIKLRDDWSYKEGAAFPVQVLTAWYALKKLGDLKAGQTVLIHSAAGGVGLLANRIAKKFRAFTIGVVGNKDKVKILNNEGFDRTLVRDRFFKQNLEHTLQGRPLNLVLETTGSKYFKYSYDALAPQGRLVAYGSAQFTPAGSRANYLSLVWKYLFRPRIDPLSMITENKSVMAFNLIWLYEQNEMLRELMDEVDKLNLGSPHIGHVFRFDDLKKALLLFKSGRTEGKIIIEVS